MTHTAEEPISVAVPIEADDRKTAYRFAEPQPTPERAEQTYRNTLAVLVTQRYLRRLGVETTPEASHSWNPLARRLEDVADLYIPCLESCLECRSVQAGDLKCVVPEEVRQERLGYVIVQLNHPYQEGHLLGFVDTVSVPELPLSELKPLDELIGLFLEPAEDQSESIPLRQWLEQIFESDWQPQDDLLSTMGKTVFRTPPLVHRGEFMRRRLENLYRQQSEGKSQSLPSDLSDQETLIRLIQTTQSDNIRWQSAELLWELNPNHPACPVMTAKDLGLYLTGHRIALAIGVLPKSNGSLLVLTRIYPLGESLHVPKGLTLTGLDECGNSFFEVEARQQDNYIQFKFTADAGDRFSICIALNEASFIESFVA